MSTLHRSTITPFHHSTGSPIHRSTISPFHGRKHQSSSRLRQASSFAPTLIACSGGMDSVALLYMMAEMCKKEGVRLGACYVNHKLRESAKNESQFVDKICHDLGVEFYLAEFTDDFWGDTKANFEEKARTERYRLLFECAEKNGFQQIATAHHLDDQVETVLMRIFDRGTGIKGLAGIKPTTIPPFHHSTGAINRAPTIIRPILHMTRKEIEHFMEGREFMTDESNSDTKIRRNFYRSVVIPVIESALGNDEFKQHLAKLSENAQRETEFAEIMAREFWLQTLSEVEGEKVIPRSTIERYSDNFWLTAFSYLFSQCRDFSHSTDTLIDIVKFIRKKEPATANYHPFVFERDRDGIKVEWWNGGTV